MFDRKYKGVLKLEPVSELAKKATLFSSFFNKRLSSLFRSRTARHALSRAAAVGIFQGAFSKLGTHLRDGVRSLGGLFGKHRNEVGGIPFSRLREAVQGPHQKRGGLTIVTLTSHQNNTKNTQSVNKERK